jgi:hypothetical protein
MGVDQWKNIIGTSAKHAVLYNLPQEFITRFLEPGKISGNEKENLYKREFSMLSTLFLFFSIPPRKSYSFYI